MSVNRAHFLRSLLGLALLLLAGCNSLPAGDISSINARAAIESRGKVVLLRGWRGLYSDGIDQLASELAAEGFQTVVYRESQWREIAAALNSPHQSSYFPLTAPPLVLIGFSYGADNAISIARNISLTSKVRLLVAIDPVTPDEVPPNVIECYDIYRSNGWLDVFPFLRGVPLKASPEVRLSNLNLQDHPELDDPGMGHRHIAGSAKVHRAIIQQVLIACPPRERQRPTTRAAN